MNRIVDHFLVGLLLLASLGYALTALGPRALRRRAFGLGARFLMRVPGLGGIAQRLEAAAAKTQGACGGCGSCAPKTPASEASAPEIRVSLAGIGRRSVRRR